MFSTPPKSLCILRLSAIGDVCNTIAAVQAIQTHWPDTKITWITGKVEAQLLAAIDNVEIITFDKKAGWKGYQALWKQLKGRHFDALLHMQYALRASIASLGIKAKFKLGFSPERSQDFQTLFTNVKVPSPDSLHVADGLMAFAYTLGVPKTITPKWNLTYPQEDQQWASTHLNLQSRNLVIVPGASKAYKNWHAQGYVDVIKHMRAKGWHIILAGSPAKVERQLADEIQQLLETPCVNLVGKSSMLQMLALLDHADLVLCPDTGPAHMASAMQTPVVVLCAHHNPERVGPYYYRDSVVSVYEQQIHLQTGKSVDELDWRERVQNPKAMEMITAEHVTQTLDNVVNNRLST